MKMMMIEVVRKERMARRVKGKGGADINCFYLIVINNITSSANELRREQPEVREKRIGYSPLSSQNRESGKCMRRGRGTRAF